MEIRSGGTSVSESQDRQRPEMPEATSGQGQASSDIAMLAYVLWEQRGCPVGSPEQDWMEAEQRMRETAMQAGK